MYEKLLKAIEQAKGVMDEDANLAFFMVRDYPELKEWGLDELAWAGYRQGDTHKNDFLFLVECIEKRIADNEME